MYNHKEIEQKWQKYWEENKTFKVENDFSKPKYYTLDMFPYPSGAGLHVGHPEGMTANDIVARYKTAKGFNVLHPMGWDAFGLPAENYAIKTGTHPRITTDANIANFTKQIKALGFSYDWDREIDTTDPEYYKWTQWIFLKLFEKGLAYEQDLPINYCPSCKTGLANEEVLNDFTCERCGEKVEKKKIRQWVLAITKYADRLLNDVDKLDWPEGIKDMQRNWIGKSEGCEFSMKVVSPPLTPPLSEEGKMSERQMGEIQVYTTRIDTVFGMTYAVLAPDHKDVEAFITDENKAECDAYIEAANKQSDQDRTADNKEKTGVFTGSHVINPFNGQEVPLWIGDYVLGNYGTGAVMAVPAHDERDFEFAKKYGLESMILELGQSEAMKIGYEEMKNRTLSIKQSITPNINFSSLGKIVDNTYTFTKDLENLFNYYRDKLLSFNKNPEDFEYWNKHGEVVVGVETLLSNILEHDIGIRKRDYDIFCKIISELNLNFGEYGFKAFTDYGILVNSGEFSGLESKEAQNKMIEFAEKNGFGTKKVNYKLRDWLFSRQRYWGEPIPLVHCDDCGIVGEKEENLPILLPETDNFEPSGDGTSPLTKIESFVNCECPKCGKPAKRETNTMPQWGGSCWYYLRYMDPNNSEKLVDSEVVKYWGEVDSYVGGAEHAVLHLLYARFWHKFLFDIGVVPTDEPFYRLRNQGLILAHAFERKNGGLIANDLVEQKGEKYYEIENGEEVNRIVSKMSKSLKNVVNPDDIVEEYGADSLRLYEMYMAEFKDTAPWDSKGIVGVRRFLDKVDRAFNSEDGKVAEDDNEAIKLLNKTIKKVEEDITNYKFNTAIASMMILVNYGRPTKASKLTEWKTKFTIILSAFAPHLGEELWKDLGNKESVFFATWPEFDAGLVVDDTIKIGVQVLGKLRETIEIGVDEAKDSVLEKAKNEVNVAKWIEGKTVVKEIYVPGKIVNLVVR